MAAAQFEISRKCKYCGKSFAAKTITSVYCSPSCSKGAYKRKKKEEKIKQLKIEKALEISDDKEYLSVPEAEALYDVSRFTIYRSIRKGRIPSYNLGERFTMVRRKELEELFDLRPITQTPAEETQSKTYSLEVEDCYSIGEIMKKFSVSETTVYKHIRKYGIPIRHLGKYVYAPKTEIDNLYK